MTSGLTGKGTKRRARLSRLMIVSSLLIVLAVAIFVLELIQFSQREDRLPLDITVGGIAVGGLSPTDARIVIEQTYAQPLVLYYGESPILLDPASIGFRLDIQTMLADAISAGDANRSFWVRFFNYLIRRENQQVSSIPLLATYQQSLLEQTLQDISHRYDQDSGKPSYDVQTLTTFSGANGTVLNISEAVSLIDAAIRNPNNRAVTLPTGGTNSARPSMETLRQLIISYLDTNSFIYDGQTTIASVFIMNLQTGEEINLLGDVAFTAASTMKVPILVTYYRQLDTEPTQDEAWLMANSLLCSRNSSSNLLMQIIGGGQDIFSGISRVIQTIQFIGARNTFITAPFIEGDPNQPLGSIAKPTTAPNPNFNTNPDPFNQSTAEDLGTTFSMIYDCANYGSGLMAAFENGEFTQNECRQMLELMSANNLLRLLQAGIPENVRISHKNGWVNDTVGDVGIVYPPNGQNYVIGVFLWEQAEFQDFERLWPLLEGISRAAWNYFSPESPLLSPKQTPAAAQACEGNYLPPNAESVNLDDIDAWKNP
jgi:beta-lactamase class A